MFSFVKAEDLPKTNFTKIVGLSAGEWSVAGENDGNAYRSVIAGKRGSFAIANWWGGAPRAPSGSVFILEIKYQDKIKNLAVVSCFSGLGRRLGPTEIHRFGGLGDGLWKTAYIPVSWDLLLLRKGDTMARFSINNGDKENELPLADIIIRKAILPDDRIRYDAETRDWLKRCFGGSSSKIEVPVKDLALGDKFKDKVILPFARPYYDNINRFDTPTVEELEGRVYIRAATNEYEPGAFGVHAREDLQNVTFQVSDLTNKEGKLDCKIQLLTMGFDAMVKYNKDKTRGYYFKADKLWTAYPENLRKGETAWFWIKLKTEEGKPKPGTYEGKITITSGKIKEELPIRVDVLPIRLLTMEEAGLWMGGCVTGLVSEQEMITMREHNHNMVNIWAADVLPEFNKEKDKDKLTLGFYYLDDFMQAATRSGQNRMVWFFGGNPPGFPGTLSLERQLYSAF